MKFGRKLLFFALMASALLAFITPSLAIEKPEPRRVIMEDDIHYERKYLDGEEWGRIPYDTRMYTKADVDYILDNLVIPAKTNCVAMFIIPVDNESLFDDTVDRFNGVKYTGFELKATTNNFDRATPESVRLQFYAASPIADTGLNGMWGNMDIDKMHMFVCTTKITDQYDWRGFHYIPNTTIWREPITFVVVFVDNPCIVLHREDDGEWLDEDNEELTWRYIRICGNQPNFECEPGTVDKPLWRPINPARWYTKLPDWAAKAISNSVFNASTVITTNDVVVTNTTTNTIQ